MTINKKLVFLDIPHRGFSKAAASITMMKIMSAIIEIMTIGTIWKRSTIIPVIKSSVACISYNYDKSIDSGNGSGHGGDSSINCNNINAGSLSINLSTSTLGTYLKTSDFHHYSVIDCIRQDNNAHYS